MPQYQRFVIQDPLIGWRNRANAQYTFQATEHCTGWGSSGQTNSLGLVDEEYNLIVPDDTFRILALGNSYTEAFHFQQAQTWTNLLESKLNALSSDIHFEVINGGHSGSGATIASIYYEERGYLLTPDLVIFLFTPHSYYYDYFAIGSSNSPHYFLENDELELDISFRDSISYRINGLINFFRSNSYVVEFFAQTLKLQLVTMRQNRTEQANASESSLTENAHPINLTDSETHALELSQAVIAHLRDTVENNGSQFILIHGTVPQLVNWDVAEQWHDLPQTLENTSAERMRDFAVEADITYYSLVEDLQRYAEETQRVIHGCQTNLGQGHWNQQGHEHVATSILNYLEAVNFIP